MFVNNFYWAANPTSAADLPKVLGGEHVGAMGMSEPAVGTDVLGMQTTARRTSSATLNGRKTFITNGPEADVALIYAKLDGRLPRSLSRRC